MNKYILFIIGIIFSLFAFAGNSDKNSNKNSDKNWVLVSDDNGIQVYTLDTPNSKIVKAKTIAVINAPLIKIKTILDDVDHRHEWIPFMVVSKALSEYENNKRIEYSHFYAPWPASDRDFVYDIELVESTKNKMVYKMKSIYSNLMPVNQEKIRADLFETVYTLTVLDDATTKVELIYHADPKGWIPNWIINIMQRVLPYKIMRNLKETVR